MNSAIKILFLFAFIKIIATQVDVIPPCEDDVMLAVCDGDDHRYHFESHKQRCSRMPDDECSITNNRFKSEEQCRTECIEHSDICQLPPRAIECDLNQKDIYYYDAINEKCKRFPKGKCGMNRNRFAKKKDCKKECIQQTGKCHLPPRALDCELNQKDIYYYDSIHNQCDQFPDGKCGLNQNRFETRKDCEEQCIPKKTNCDEEAKAGKCDARHPNKFYYNKKQNKCTKFKRDKCGRNKNSFKTKKDCENKCKKLVDVCGIKPKGGKCSLKHNDPWFYDSKENKCSKFKSKKCGITENRFNSKQKCESRCLKDVCEIEPQTQKCKHKNPFLYYFDPKTKKCTKYKKQKCPKNANKFRTEKECNKKCKGMKV